MQDRMLRRRRFLATVGSVGTVLTAGCSGGGDGGGDGDGDGDTPTESPTASPTPTPTTPNEEAVEQYETAIEALVSNKGTLDDWDATGSDVDPADLKELRDTLSTANEALSAAESAADPDGELIQRIEQAKRVAILQEGLISFYDLVLQYLDIIDEASRLQDNGEHTRAAESWAEAEQLAKNARTLFEDTKAVHEQIDSEVLAEPELDYSGEFIDYIDIDHPGELDAAVRYTNGFEQYNYAFAQLQTGLDAWENEAYADAGSAWETGRSRLEKARPEFQAVVDNPNAGDDLNATSQDLLEIIDSLFDVFDKFIQGSEEAEAGNIEEGQQLVKEGLNTLDQIF